MNPPDNPSGRDFNGGNEMTIKHSVATICLVLSGAGALAEERVGVPGSSVVFATPIESKVGDRR